MARRASTRTSQRYDRRHGDIRFGRLERIRFLLIYDESFNREHPLMGRQASLWHIVGQGLVDSVLVVDRTLLGVVWQEDHAEPVRFRGEAQVTDEETSRLFNDGCNELTGLVDAPIGNGWKVISQLSEREY